MAPDLTPLDLPLSYPLAVANEPISDMYFLTAGFASTVATANGEGPIEIGITGREGFVSLPVVLGADRSQNDIYMQLAGHGLRIPADRLLAAMAASAPLAITLQRFAHIFMLQSASSVLANGRASLEARLARWLLMAHDRIDGDDLALTHGFLSIMLGVRRAGVTDALRNLERKALIVRRRALSSCSTACASKRSRAATTGPPRTNISDSSAGRSVAALTVRKRTNSWLRYAAVLS